MEILTYLNYAVERKASDLHIAPTMPPMVRIDGELQPIEDTSILDAEKTKVLVASVMDDNQKNIFNTDFEIDFSFIKKEIGSFRVNAYQELRGAAAAFRVIPTVIPTLEDLALPEVFRELLDFPNGLILVTGPTGSGKSTTLAAMINYINTKYSNHIITIEDPIEFIHESKLSLINQRQLNRDTHSFKAALKSALREDPDVILLGEMRDLETIRLALTAAETGHLVMATLHTSGAPRAINRIVDVFHADEKEIIRNMLSESLRAVITQTLLKKTTGGRIPAFEIMLGIPAIRNLIREDQVAQMYTAIQTNAAKGMCTLDQYLQKLIKTAAISQATAREVASNREMFCA